MRQYDGPYYRRAKAAVEQGNYLDGLDAWARIWSECDYKDTKRRKGNWFLPENTILILQLVETPIDELELFGIWPQRWWGRHSEGRLSGKPDG